jgi:hypothetical protein
MPKSQQHRRESQLVTAKFKKVHQSETFAQNHNYNDKMSLKNIDTLKTKTKLVPSKKLDEEKSANDSMLIDEEDPILLNDHSNVRSPLQPPRQTLPMYPPIWAHVSCSCICSRL